MVSQLEKDERTCDRNRNQICVCGSTLKFKDCCWAEHNTIPEDKVSGARLKVMLKDAKYMMKRKVKNG